MQIHRRRIRGRRRLTIPESGTIKNPITSYLMSATASTLRESAGTFMSQLEPGLAEDHKLILIVDDDPGVRQLLYDFLCGSYSCFLAANAEEAFACLEKETFALIILDVIMPGLSGIEVLRK